MIPVPVFPSAKCRAWPKHEDGPRAHYGELGDVLTSTYRTDAHFACYSEPSIERRLSLDAPAQLGHSVSMVVHAFDVDGPDHVGNDSWFDGEREKIEALFALHPGGFVYRTRGGYRPVYLRRTPFEILTQRDAAMWSQAVLVSIGYLRRFGIVADSACLDWTRLYRCPRATRDGNSAPEDRETIGNAFAIGPWVPRIEPKDRELALSLRRRPNVVPAGAYGHNDRAVAVNLSAVERARAYLATIPGAIAGQRGHDATYRAAVKLVIGFDLDAAIALELLREWNARCQPPWSDRELVHKIKSALNAPAPARGYLLKSGRAA